MEMSGVFTFALSMQCEGKYQGFVLYRQKKAVQCNRLWGKTAMALPADCPRSVGVIAGD